MAIESWTKWVILSLADHLKTQLSGDYFWIQGIDVSKEASEDRFEFRYTGPDIDKKSSQESHIHLTINCTIATKRERENLTKQLNRIGQIHAAFAVCIPTYKYGDGDEDDQSAFYSLQRMTGLVTTSFGVDPVTRIDRTTVETTYRVVVEES